MLTFPAEAEQGRLCLFIVANAEGAEHGGRRSSWSGAGSSSSGAAWTELGSQLWHLLVWWPQTRHLTRPCLRQGSEPRFLLC